MSDKTLILPYVVPDGLVVFENDDITMIVNNEILILKSKTTEIFFNDGYITIISYDDISNNHINRMRIKMKTLKVKIIEEIRNSGIINVPDHMSLEEAYEYACRNTNLIQCLNDDDEVVECRVDDMCDFEFI